MFESRRVRFLYGFCLYNYMVRLQALLFFVDSFCLDELSDFLLQPCQEKLYMITIRCGMVAAQ